ncbi:Transcription initiation factor IIA subunit 1 [Wickerhamiella sorbophila]|uniref:Transcription initiation factor IIA subunit 1 n=1 Tax=Wickerhamiella sorbophila TaxID=45607 RepID=A0A2T0FN10_9ASCO|nr:Transcription initiation factor IIA subunit 1 [Wickerhamiella sorbophila]PRT56371.1 Transcription initiation factor IIA subunit 1 [Wickerhamiella sorbophila]
MSNQIGDLYQSVIDEVLENARQDFQERGEDDSVLNLLRNAWQQRLSEMRVGVMPWDNAGPTIPTSGYDPIYGYRGTAEMPQLSGIPPATGQNTLHTLPPGNGLSIPGTYTNNGGLVLPRLPQTDGLNGDESEEIKPDVKKEDDSGDLGSDLGEGLSDAEESEDELNSENDGEEGGDQDVILSLYDKVQRVRNRWKYVLKDGIVNIGGKDYVFSRGTGESEW